jgi:predicted deacylase
MDDAKTLELAQAFGAPVVLNSNILDGSLRASAAGLGMPMLIYEAGEARRFDEVCIRAGIRGVLNVMRAVGMLPEDRKTKLPDSVVARRTKWIRAPESGIVCDKVKIGSKVLEGQRLATISDPLGTVDVPLKAPFDGIVIGCTNLPLAYEGEALFHIAAFEDVSEVESAVEDFSAKHEPELRDD